MVWSGSTYRKGNYSTNGWTGDAANNIGIEAGRHDIQDDDFAQGITDCINKNGLNSPSTNLSMGGYRHTNVAQAAASTDYARFDQVMDRGGTQAATANMNLGTYKITNLGNGTVSTDAAAYGQIMDRAGANAATGNISLGSNKITNLANGSASTDAAAYGQVMDRAGVNAATGNISLGSNKITNLANATDSTDAATYGQVTTLAATNTPVGTITMYSGASAPTGWFLCDGATKSRTTYSALWDVLRNGTASSPYGNGDGSTTFNVPNLTQRFPLGKASSGTGVNLGDTGGSIDHTHTNYGHYHSMTGAGTTLATGTTNSGHGHGFTLTADTGGAHTHTYLKPNASVAVNSGGISVWDNTTSSATIASSGAHSHTVSGTVGGTDGTHTHNLTGSIGNVTGAKSGDIDQATSGSNPPYLVVNYIIKY